MLTTAAASVSAADLPSAIPTITPPPPAAPCDSVNGFFTTNCTLSAYGVTVYGILDLGAAYQTHGTPFNRVSVTGLEYLVTKNSGRSIFSEAPNGLSNSVIGIQGLEPLFGDTAFIFDLEAGFDPYTLTFSNGPGSLQENNGKSLFAQTTAADSSRAGQFYNALGYAGLSSPTYGTLTVGRQNSLTLDGVIAYDPQSASYAFSPIGYSGLTAGVGDTEDARYTTSVKYKLRVGQFRVAGLYQFGDYANDNASTGAYEFAVGGDFLTAPTGGLSVDVIYSYVENAVAAAALTSAQNAKYPGTLAATLSNDSSEMLLAKYKYQPFTVYGGYEHILFTNPSRGADTFQGLGGYTFAAPDISVTAYTHHRNLSVFWGGVKYAVLSNVDVIGAYYEYLQDNYAAVRCSNASSAACSGALHAVSGVVDWHILPKLDTYAGVMLSEVENGLANGYLHRVTADPMVGLRFRF